MGWFSRLLGNERPQRDIPPPPPPADPAAERAKGIELLQAKIAQYGDYESICDEHADQSLVIPKKNEQMLGIVRGVSLTETRRTKGQYRGGSQGVSIRIAKGVSYRVGAHKGEFVPGPEKPVVIDRGGAAVISDLRVVYVGSKYTREFRWDKLISFSTDWSEGLAIFLLPVENRQKVSGIGVPAKNSESISVMDERMKLGLSIHQDRLPEFLEGLREELDELLAEEKAAGTAFTNTDNKAT